MAQPKIGCIYIMTSMSFPHLVKLGYSDDVYARLRKLNRSEALPYPFELYATYGVKERLSDHELHRLIDKLNPDLRTKTDSRIREFYAMSAEDAYEMLECIAKISGTIGSLQRLSDFKKEEPNISNASTKRRERFHFESFGIPVGAELTFTENNAIHVQVLPNDKVSYKGNAVSMSALAMELLQVNHAIQGTLYFAYKGERLTDLRSRMEKEGIIS